MNPFPSSVFRLLSPPAVMKRFEDLPLWHAARDLVRRVHALTHRPPFSHDPGLCDQIQRAAVSLTSNIAEGHERGTTQDLIQFLLYAKGSLGEVRSQLCHVEDLGYALPEECERLRAFCLDLARGLSAWIQTMQSPEFRRGPRYHREPDQRWEHLVRRAGMTRMPDGRFRPTTENGSPQDKTTTSLPAGFP